MKILLILSLLAPVGAGAVSGLIEEAKRKHIPLSEKEERVLEVGVVPRTNYVLGGVIGTWPVGLGTGHMVQGRWYDRGWKFTAVELASLGTMLASGECVGKVFRNKDNDCTGINEVVMLGALFAFTAFRVWEIYDVWAVPPRHNARYHKLRERIETAPEPSASLDLVPVVTAGSGAGLGLRYAF